jgi:ABC-2 type transport system ATP-binding protein
MGCMAIYLSVQGLHFQYGKRVAVDSISFEVARGEVLGLLGPNGAGKSTTISCIAGLAQASSGAMSLSGNRFEPAKDVAARKELGLVPQELAIYDNLTARENLCLFAKLAGLRGNDLTTRVNESLQLAGLEDRSDDRVQTFSGGMKRRLNLASGIVHSPSLVLLDEPTVGVDPQSRNHLFDSILALKRAGASMIYTTHYMEEAERLCDRIAIMNEGVIIATGTPKQLIDQSGASDATLETVFLQLTGRKLRDE